MKIIIEIPNDEIKEAGMDSTETREEFLNSLQSQIAETITDALGFDVNSVSSEGVPEWE